MPLLATLALGANGTFTSTPIEGLAEIGSLNLLAMMNVVGGGGTTIVRVQTSLDEGGNWFDVARFDFTTSSANKYGCVDARVATVPTAIAALGTADTKRDGLLGDRLRIEVTTSGTVYTQGSSISVFYQTQT
ncbi:MAG: hypothetical protein ACK53W_12590 [Gemmatimonadota bacterium]